MVQRDNNTDNLAETFPLPGDSKNTAQHLTRHRRARAPQLRIGQLGKVLGPDPADAVARVVLVSGEPQFSLFGHDVEDLVFFARRVSFVKEELDHDGEGRGAWGRKHQEKKN